jgi:hypothetical protein
MRLVSCCIAFRITGNESETLGAPASYEREASGEWRFEAIFLQGLWAL